MRAKETSDTSRSGAENQDNPPDGGEEPGRMQTAFQKGKPHARDWGYLASGLSEKERELLEALVLPDVEQIQEAADRIGMNRDGAYHLLLRLKMKYTKAKGYKNEVDYYWAKLRKQGPKKEKWLQD